MLILFLILSILLFVFVADWDDDGIFAFFAFLIPVVCVIALIVNITKIVDGRYIDDQIKLYTEENAKIETEIDELVSEYMEYESNTLANVKGESSITLVSLYPELKSDELVKELITTYQDNNAEIKDLKEKKLKITANKWWVYFGK